MGQARPTFERRQLGLTLRRLRDEAGKTQQAAADAVGKVRSRIIELEDGKATISQEDLAKLLDCYDVTGEERSTVLELGAQARHRQKRRVYVDHLPDAYQRFADLEASATEINWFETGIIPGLLQSPLYMKAILAECEGVWWEPSTQEGEDRLAFRIERQRRLLDPPDQRIVRIVVTEDALRANMGSTEAMREQLRHILALFKENRDLTVRVLPNDTYGNPVRGTGLWYFGFGDRATPVGYSPAVPGPAIYYDDEADTTAMSRAFYRVWELALSRVESRRFIERVEKELFE
ncbi:helix-turn-helix protein [Herbihabitans rhizosphaerae]|uniref:Helix-turn-helix protein n=1 Tax=Herbihabitans rhizosphaerae TaxID=1872711 RepID=A0A4Q7L1E7_9PSEU|nr:helix-turn-helix transcriptional regulator [Herbihabitans rhizosphaerae]RZS43348.1 helix-turn-helix protein [Herbihabitans rhizosphaerae]